MTDKAKIEILKIKTEQLEKENEQLKGELAKLPDTLKLIELLTAAKSQYEQLTKETLEIKSRYLSVLEDLSLLKKKYKRNFFKEINDIKKSKRR